MAGGLAIVKYSRNIGEESVPPALWSNSPQELQVSLCLLAQKEAPAWGGPGLGKQRLASQNSLLCPCVPAFSQVSFANIIWSLWEFACILDRTDGTSGHCQAHRWEVREKLAECLARGWPLNPVPLCAGHLCKET